MVSRKPAGPPLNTTSPTTSSTAPPYPTSPTVSAHSPRMPDLDRAKTIHSAKSVYSPNLASSPAFDLIDMDEARQRARRDSDVSSHGTWDDSGDEAEANATPEGFVEVPKPLRISKSQQDIQQQAHQKDELPAALKPGPSTAQQRKSHEELQYEEEAHANPWASSAEEAVKSPVRAESNNPYRQHNGFAPQPSQNVWQEPASLAPPPNAPPPPPVELSTAPKTPAEELSNMSLNGQGQQVPWPRPQPKPFETAEILAVPQPPVLSQSPPQNQPFPSNNPWRTPPSEPQEPPALSAPSSPAPPPKKPVQPASPQYVPPPGPPRQRSPQQQYAPPPGPPPKGAPAPPVSLIDVDGSTPSASNAVPSVERQAQQSAPIVTSHGATQSVDSIPETPGAAAKRQRNEHYQIKHISWYDASYTSDPRFRNAMRRSPILVQNANGPCPLLALVNALVLSTPQNVDTALVETLRTREQVSLGLLLDAVFDELTSGRRGDTAERLPDVGELYKFLLALHTGMNVNPRFVTPAAAPRGSLDLAPPDKAHLHPLERAQTKAGCFEETKEMQLYSTFNIPLIHGWIAPKDTPAYAAFERQAQTFEDAQNLLFIESELEDKLRNEGLSHEEQQVLQDIQLIKSFLATWPTQLTDYGLESISASLRPGQVAILFRNDHFCTVYKEPRHGALMTLVTDAGYSSHDEIVWESLVDVSGAASEMFSGDFRVVSHGADVANGAYLNQGSSGGGEDGWQTVQRRNRAQGEQIRPQNGALRVTNGAAQEIPPPLPGPRPQQQTTSAAGAATGSEDLAIPSERQRTQSEQEDHDLALALQLQEEEEDQHRQAEERRRREQVLSEQFLSSEGEGPRPPIPPRRSGAAIPTSPNPNASGNSSATAPQARPGVNRPADAARADDPDAPPTYEQSASDRPYRPAGSTAAPQQGNPLNAYDALRRQQQQQQQQQHANLNVNSGGGAGLGNARRQSQNLNLHVGGNSNARLQRRSVSGGQLQSPHSPYAGTGVPHGSPVAGRNPGGRGAGAGPGQVQVGGPGENPGGKDDDRCVMM